MHDLFDVPGHAWHFRIAEPPQWFDFVQRNPEQELQPWKPCAWGIEQQHAVSLFFDALKPFKSKYLPDLSDHWKLGLPGDCEDYALSLRAMLAAANVVKIESMQPAIIDMKRGQHFVLLVPTEDHGLMVFDPILKATPIPITSMNGRVTCATDGQKWYILRPGNSEKEPIDYEKSAEVEDHRGGSAGARD